MSALRRPEAVALDLIVQNGRARISNATRPEQGTVSWRTAQSLERKGLVHALEIVAVPTDAGKQAAADGLTFTPRRYDHGTHAGYVFDGCRCEACRVAHVAYERQRKRDELQGRPRTVDAEPVRDHVRSLMAAGVGLKTIAKRSGVAHGTLRKLIYGAPDRKGPSRRVRHGTAEKLLAVTPADMADGAYVPAEGTRNRLREMLDAGWANRHLARHLDISESNFRPLLSRRQVTAGTARRVAALHAAWKDGEVPTEGRRSPWPARRQGMSYDVA